MTDWTNLYSLKDIILPIKLFIHIIKELNESDSEQNAMFAFEEITFSMV